MRLVERSFFRALEKPIPRLPREFLLDSVLRLPYILYLRTVYRTE